MITRFAPSPTGPLHLGHAYSAMIAHDMASQHGGTFLLRIEDIDQSRARPAWEAQIFDELAWLGLVWPVPVMRQSARLSAYAAALDRLWAMDVLYPCTCSRRDIKDALGAPQEGAAPYGADGLIYPGICRGRPKPSKRPENKTLRLDVALATAACGMLVWFEESQEMTVPATDLLTTTGDPVIARHDMHSSYHLAVVVDDAAQEVSDVVRGADLKDATPLHVLLQELLSLPVPHYHHHPLIRDDAGKRLAKRDDARALAKYRAEGATPDDIRRMVNLPPA